MPDAYIPGQIIIAIRESDFSEGLIDEMKDRHGLDVIDVSALRSVGLKMVLFKDADKDIFKKIDELRKDKRMIEAQPNYIFQTMGDPLRKTQYAIDIIKTDRVHKSYKGKGIKVAVIDTGVDTDHNDLKDRVILKKNFIRGEGYTPEIHGTAIAGIISAGVNGFGIEGVAPEAKILAMRACRQISKGLPEGECFSDSLSRAMDEAILQKAGVVNMSFGTTYNDGLLSRLIDAGVRVGNLFVAPAGNLKDEKELRFPASHPSVISVGGFDERLNPYPNGEIVKKTVVNAPSVNVITTFPKNKHNFLSGTSLASAHISGILALALEKDRGINKQKLPIYKGDLCKWEEELLKIPLCGK